MVISFLSPFFISLLARILLSVSPLCVTDNMFLRGFPPIPPSGKGLWQLIANENFTLYRGWNWTIARNVPGSFALFGGNSLTKQMLGLDPKMSGQATLAQNAIASVAGATCSITVAAPMDVIKTRIQQNSHKQMSGVKIVADLVREEGPTAFFKGLGPKILVVGPKLVFSMTIAQSVLGWFARRQ
mmetsp:Transcript_25164/g.49094  ORF Transcript_25164/g.49094 Transcript_25164/m.49094 type:complete len:185 (-) Transcript_25164:152-706(-)